MKTNTSESGRGLLGLLLLLVALAFVASWALGETWKPWISTVRQSAQGQLHKLLDEVELKRSIALERRDEAREKHASLCGIIAREKAFARRYQGHLHEAERAIEDHLAFAGSMETSLAAGDGLVRVGRPGPLSPAEVIAHVDDLEQKLMIERERAAFYRAKLDERTASIKRREVQLNGLPGQIDELNREIEFLKQKTVLYREMEEVHKREKPFEEFPDDWYREAKTALEDAHMAVDTRLAELGSYMGSIDSFPLELEVAAPTTEAAVAALRRLRDAGSDPLLASR